MRGLLLNRLMHSWLGEMGLITVISFIVAVTTVANDIDHNVTLMLCAIVSCKLTNEVDDFNVVAINIEDRRIYELCNVGRVGSRGSKRGSVVKPIWLFAMRWMVPPVP